MCNSGSEHLELCLFGTGTLDLNKLLIGPFAVQRRVRLSVVVEVLALEVSHELSAAVCLEGPDREGYGLDHGCEEAHGL